MEDRPVAHALALPHRPAPAAQAAATTRLLLGAGAAAGPLYLVVGLAQALTRPGFDLGRHDLSLLSNGDLGWIQITNFLLSGALVIAGAVGLRRALGSGRGATWAPVLVGAYGLGLIGAGLFRADPALGFPPGTPADASSVSWHGLLHFATGGTGFLALIAACGIFSRRFAALQQRGWAAYSAITGVVFCAAFVGIAAGAGNSSTILGFWAGVVLAWSWLTALSAYLISELPAR
jgi:Protein of unknown function (DUF998)